MKPSPQAIESAAAVLAQCQANDQHFVHIGDAMTLAWAEHIMIANIPRDDLLDAVTKWYGTPHDRPPKAADIIALARTMRQDRFQRSEIGSPEWLSYEDHCNFKAGFPVSGMDDREHGKPVSLGAFAGSVETSVAGVANPGAAQRDSWAKWGARESSRSSAADRW
jgi:hypothetical protein